MAVQDFFTWGAGGQKLTPGDLARRREIEDALLAKGPDFSPVADWTQGLARVANAAAGAYRRNRLGKAEGENAEINKGLIANLLAGGSGATSPASSSAIPMSGAAGEMAATSPGSTVGATGPEAYRNAIASIESAGSGDYSAVGPTNDKLGRALGRYQIMEANIGPWSQEALGRAVTPEEFLADPALQDAIFDKKFGSYVEQFGPEGAAQAWFAGPGGVGKVNRQDVLGTNVGEYGSRFLSALGSGGGTPAAAAIDAVAPAAAGEIAMQPATSAQPVQVAGGGDRAPMASASTGINPAIIEALTNPQASEQTQRIAGILLQQDQARQNAAMEAQMREADPLRKLQIEKGQLEIDALRNPQPKETDEIREYNFARSQGFEGTFADFKQQMKKAGATNVVTNVGEGDKFYENLDKKNAEMFSALSEEGVRGRGKLAQINRLQGLLSAAPQGGLAALKQAAGEYGINTEGLSDIQSAQALINELVPQQRQPGSGPMSDADLALFKQSLPRIINQPGGNETIVNTMRGITEYQVRMGEIADAVADRSMTPTQGREAIRNLKNPLEDYTKLVRGIENDEQDQGWREISPGVRVRKID